MSAHVWSTCLLSQIFHKLPHSPTKACISVYYFICILFYLCILFFQTFGGSHNIIFPPSQFFFGEDWKRNLCFKITFVFLKRFNFIPFELPVKKSSYGRASMKGTGFPMSLANSLISKEGELILQVDTNSIFFVSFWWLMSLPCVKSQLWLPKKVICFFRIISDLSILM